MSQVLDRVREKYPQYADVSDDELTLRLGSKYPVYFDKDSEFKSDYVRVAGTAGLNAAVSATNKLVSTLQTGAIASDAGHQAAKEQAEREAKRIPRYAASPIAGIVVPSEEELQAATKPIGMGMAKAGEFVGDVAKANALLSTGQPVAAAEQLGLVKTDNERKPWEQGLATLPKAAQIPSKAAEGLIESTPQFAAVAVGQALGIPAPIAMGAVFGTTPEGFSGKDALVAAALPYVGKYSGQITAKIAQKFGVTTERALQIYHAAGGASGTVGYLGTIAASEIAELPEGQREDAVIDAIASNMGLFALGMAGAAKPLFDAAKKMPETAQATRAALESQAKQIAIQTGADLKLPVGAKPIEPRVEPVAEPVVEKVSGPVVESKPVVSGEKTAAELANVPPSDTLAPNVMTERGQIPKEGKPSAVATPPPAKTDQVSDQAGSVAREQAAKDVTKLNPERRDEVIQMLQDSIATKKANGDKVPEEWIQKLGKLQAEKRGESPVESEVFSDETMPGHPLNSENPVLPIKLPISQQGLDSIAWRTKAAQDRIEAARLKLRTTKGANRDDLELEIENMMGAQKELGRMSRKIEAKLTEQPPAPSPEPAVQPTGELAGGQPTVSGTFVAKTPDATTQFNAAKTGNDFKISTSDGSNVTGYLDGEIFYVESKKPGAGTGTSLMVDALRLLASRGNKTVSMMVAGTDGGKALVAKLVREGYISKPIETKASGTTVHKLLTDQEGNKVVESPNISAGERGGEGVGDVVKGEEAVVSGEKNIAEPSEITPSKSKISDVGIPERVPPIISTPEEKAAWLSAIRGVYGEGTPEAYAAIKSLKDFAKSGRFFDTKTDFAASSRSMGNIIRALGVDISHKGGGTSLTTLGANKIRIADTSSLFHELGHAILLSKSGGLPWKRSDGVRGEWKALNDTNWGAISIDSWNYWTQQTERYARLLNIYVKHNAKFKSVAPELYAKVERLLDESAPTIALFQEARRVGVAPQVLLNEKLKEFKKQAQQPTESPPALTGERANEGAGGLIEIGSSKLPFGGTLKPNTLYVWGADWHSYHRKEVLQTIKHKGDPLKAFDDFKKSNPSVAPQVIMSTDAKGKPSKVLAPNRPEMWDFGTPEANYMAGDIHAFRKDRLKRYQEALGKNDIDAANAAIQEGINDATKKADEQRAAAEKNAKSYEVNLAKQKAGVPIKEVDDRFSNWKEFLENEKRAVEANLEGEQQYRQEADQWRKKLVKKVGSEPTEQPPTQPATQPAEQIEGQKIVGMGGAVTEEFTPSAKSATSNKNAVVDSERVARGEEPMMAALKRTWGEVWDKAMALIDKDPSTADRLIKELTDSPRPITDVENAVLNHRRVDLNNEYAKATRDAAQAYEDSKTYPERLDDLAAANARTQHWSNELAKLEQATKVGGTETGRALNARRMMVNEDFTLAKLEMDKRADNNWKSLEELDKAANKPEGTTRAELQKIADEHKAKSEALEKRLAEVEKEQENKIAQAVLDQAKKDAAKAQPYSKQVLDIAERIVAGWDKAADAARARMIERMKRTNISLDPTNIYDLAVLGRSYLGHAALDVAKFTAKLVQDVGEWAKEYGEEAYKKANELIAEEGKKAAEGSLTKKAIKKITKQDSPQAAIDKIRERLNKIERHALSWNVRKLARLLVESGIKDRNELVDTLWGYLKPAFPEITRRQTMDLVSGYGEYHKLSKDWISTTLRDLKGQLQAVAKIEDMAGGEAPKKTGLERRVPSDEERRLIKQVEEAKRRGGYRVTDPASQLRTALDARKTYYRNQISDLETQIAKREKFIKQRTKSPTDSELESLKSRRDELKKEFDEIFAKPELTDAERLQIWKDRTRKKIAEYEERIRVGDVSTRQKPKPVQMDREAVRLQYDLHQVHRRWMEMRAADKRKQWTQMKKIGYGALETLNTVRAFITSYDLSAVLRQGGFIAFGHPVRAAKSIVPMLKAFASKESAFRIMQEIRSRENAPLYEQAKLELTDYGTKLSAQEEAFMSRFAEKIPGVGASQRAYTTFLNKLRADSFDAMAAKLTATGKPTIEEAKLLANYINIATGRGKIGFNNSNVAVGANAVFFAPRYVASRFQLLAASPIWSSVAKYEGTAAARKMIAMEYARFLGGAAVVYALGQAAGAAIENDPRSSDFGKLKFGNTRIDPLFGLLQNTVFLSRMASGETKTQKGKVRPLREPLFGEGKGPRYGESTSWDVITRFGRSKLSPATSLAVNLATGKDVVGKPFTKEEAVKQLMVPITYQDIIEAAKQQGIPEATIYAMLSIFGAGVSTYEDKPRRF